MRAELELIATIEKFLLGELSDVETKVFETRMEMNPDLKNDVELQANLMHSLERISLQQSIQTAQKTYQFWKLIKLIGAIVSTLIIGLIVWYVVTTSDQTSVETRTIPTKVEQQTQATPKDATTTIVSIPDTIIKKKTPMVTTTASLIFEDDFVENPLERIPSEVFTITPAKDTIIETKNGIVFFIPENTFIDSNKKVVTENVTVAIKEAVSAETIMTAGLGTLHNGKPLETGGMFMIEAIANGEKLQLHPEKEITADIPTQEYKNDMQLFDGEIAADNTINWVNPKPLNTTLIPQDIYSLNFYPPNYLDTLALKGYDHTNKKFTDSLYYSFSHIDEKPSKTLKELVVNDALTIGFPIDTVQVDRIIVKDTIKSKTSIQKTIKGLDPLKVKTIWNERFQNTFIATKVFESRLKVIHENCKNANYMLDVYLQNLDNDLYVSDSIIAYTTGGEAINTPFYNFYQQRLTNIATVATDVSTLNQYYLKQQKIYRLALQQAQQKVDSLLKLEETYQQFSKQQLERLYLNELEITTHKVAKKLGVQLPRRINRAVNLQNRTTNRDSVSIAEIIQKEKSKRRYRATIRTTGWKNIDRIIDETVIASVQNRTTATIRNGKKSVTIRYSEYEVSIADSQKFDQLFVYLVPRQFNSFIRLQAENDRFSYQLNDLLRYRIYCIAYQNELPFYFEKTIKNTSDKIQLRQISETVLRKRLASIHAKNNSLKTEILYQTTRKTNEKTLKKYRELVELKKEIEDVIFPCIAYRTQKDVTNDALETESVAVEDIITTEDIGQIPIDFVEIAPIFPGCENLETQAARKECMSENIQSIVNRYTNTDILSKHEKSSGTHRIFTSFIIDTSGVVTNINIRANHPEAAAEIRRVLELIPKMKPASHRGKTVNIRYTLPILFRVEK